MGARWRAVFVMVLNGAQVHAVAAELLESATRLIGELYRVVGFEEMAKNVEYVLATQSETYRQGSSMG